MKLCTAFDNVNTMITEKNIKPKTRSEASEWKKKEEEKFMRA